MSSSRFQLVQQTVPTQLSLKSWQSGVMRLIGHILNLLLLPNPHTRLPTVLDHMIPLVLEP